MDIIPDINCTYFSINKFRLLQFVWDEINNPYFNCHFYVLNPAIPPPFYRFNNY